MKLFVGSYENRFEAKWQIEDYVPTVHRPCRVGPFHVYRSVRLPYFDRVVFLAFISMEKSP